MAMLAILILPISIWASPRWPSCFLPEPARWPILAARGHRSALRLHLGEGQQRQRIRRPIRQFAFLECTFGIAMFIGRFLMIVPVWRSPARGEEADRAGIGGDIPHRQSTVRWPGGWRDPDHRRTDLLPRCCPRAGRRALLDARRHPLRYSVISAKLRAWLHYFLAPARRSRFKLCGSPPEDLDGLSPLQLKELVARLLHKRAELGGKMPSSVRRSSRAEGIEGSSGHQAERHGKYPPNRPGRACKGSRRGLARSGGGCRRGSDHRGFGAGRSTLQGLGTYQVEEAVLSVHAFRYLGDWVTADARRSSRRCRMDPGTLRPTSAFRVDAVSSGSDQTASPGGPVAVGRPVHLRTRDPAAVDEKLDGFLDEAATCCAPGVRTSPWISVDQTGARHKVKNGDGRRLAMTVSAGSGTRATKSG